jgi:integrase
MKPTRSAKPTTVGHAPAAVDLDTATVALLRSYRTRQSQHRLRLGAAWRAGDLVFVRADGLPWRPDYVSREFDRLVGVYGLPRITLHGLRHTSASLQIAGGVPIEVVSKRLRHAHSGITSSIYAHLVGDAGSQAADAVAALVDQHRKTAR